LIDLVGSWLIVFKVVGVLPYIDRFVRPPTAVVPSFVSLRLAASDRFDEMIRYWATMIPFPLRTASRLQPLHAADLWG